MADTQIHAEHVCVKCLNYLSERHVYALCMCVCVRVSAVQIIIFEPEAQIQTKKIKRKRERDNEQMEFNPIQSSPIHLKFILNELIVSFDNYHQFLFSNTL